MALIKTSNLFIDPKTKDTEHGFYIHLKPENVGKGRYRPYRNKIAGINPYQALSKARNQALSVVLSQLGSQVMQSFKGLTKDQKDIINLAFSSLSESDIILASLDEAMRDTFENTINQKLLSSVMTQEKDLAEKINGKDIKLMNLIKGTEDSFHDLDELISIIQKTLQLFKGDVGRKLAKLIVITEEERKNQSIQDYSTRVQQALQDFILENDKKGAGLSKQENLHIANQLLNLVNNLKSLPQDYQLNKLRPKDKPADKGGYREDESYIKGFKTLIFNNVFSTGFAEVAAAKMDKKAISELSDAILKSVSISNIKLIGENKVTATYTNYFGEVVGESKREASQKTDIKTTLKNLYFSFLENSNSLTMEVGISNKFYKNEDFYGSLPDDELSLSFSSGGAGSLNQAINALAAGNPTLKYIAYNVYGHGTQLVDCFEELKKAILLRQILTLFSSRNLKKDFASVFFVNGYVVTIYEIIRILINKINNNLQDIEEITKLKNVKGLAVHTIKEEYDADNGYGGFEEAVYRGAEQRWNEVHQGAKNVSLEAKMNVAKILQFRK